MTILVLLECSKRYQMLFIFYESPGAYTHHA
jgi:hypothetical protein